MWLELSMLVSFAIGGAHICFTFIALQVAHAYAETSSNYEVVDRDTGMHWRRIYTICFISAVIPAFAKMRQMGITKAFYDTEPEKDLVLSELSCKSGIWWRFETMATRNLAMPCRRGQEDVFPDSGLSCPGMG
ncbi:hypothetical protein SELMODRAFT_425347 [Selaginella moellendorffii]|uniref:Uncharacterized protein n=1 Tax=Selaginella moellendorffii TaxID=88036 RepID=D8SST5_SELML|nr:hypothetical protein SELMODRAFT_425347 [Selaginella moellendorffii]